MAKEFYITDKDDVIWIIPLDEINEIAIMNVEPTNPGSDIMRAKADKILYKKENEKGNQV